MHLHKCILSSNRFIFRLAKNILTNSVTEIVRFVEMYRRREINFTYYLNRDYCHFLLWGDFLILPSPLKWNNFKNIPLSAQALAPHLLLVRRRFRYWTSWCCCCWVWPRWRSCWISWVAAVAAVSAAVRPAPCPTDNCRPTPSPSGPTSSRRPTDIWPCVDLRNTRFQTFVFVSPTRTGVTTVQ